MPENGTPITVDEDHFTWWFDGLLTSPGNEKLSAYEIASLAWNEAVKRMKEDRHATRENNK